MSSPSLRADWDADELEAVTACPACGAAPGEYRYRQLHDHLEGVAGDWDLRDCAGCHSLFLDPRPAPQAIGKAYASYYTHAAAGSAYADDNGSSLLWKLANGYMNARYGSRRTPALAAGRFLLPWMLPVRQQLDFFYRHVSRRPGRLLDVGCGNGLFLLRAQAAGWDVSGLEPDPQAAAAARASGLEVQVGTLDGFRAGQPFDVVCASHVIEHVHDPARFLQQIASLLRADGTIWLATPNAQSIGHRRYGRAWRGLEPPRHLTIFSAQALRGLLEKAGFTAIRLHRRGRGAGYILRTSQELAKRESMDVRRLSVGWVDLRASLSASAGEELVISARRSRG